MPIIAFYRLEKTSSCITDTLSMSVTCEDVFTAFVSTSLLEQLFNFVKPLLS